MSDEPTTCACGHGDASHRVTYTNVSCAECGCQRTHAVDAASSRNEKTVACDVVLKMMLRGTSPQEELANALHNVMVAYRERTGRNLGEGPRMSSGSTIDAVDPNRPIPIVIETQFGGEASVGAAFAKSMAEYRNQQPQGFWVRLARAWRVLFPKAQVRKEATT